MKLNSIKSKITVWAGLCMFFMMLIITLITIITLRESAIETAKKDAVIIAYEQAEGIKAELEKILYAAQTLALTMSAIKDKNVNLDIDREGVIDILRIALAKNRLFVSVYTCWEPDAFDGMDIGYIGEPGHDYQS